VNEWALHYKTFYLEHNFSGPFIRSLDVYEYFHVLESLPVRWSRVHYWKCNCPTCFYWAGCHHVLLASMVVDKDIRIPSRYVSQTLQVRRKRGRPGGRSDLGDDEPAARERAQNSSRRVEYQHPEVYNRFWSQSV